MKPLLPIIIWLWPCLAPAQAKEVFPFSNLDTMKTNIKSPVAKPEILTSGFIDIVSNGQVNASARFIRLQIGEPGKLALPLSIYSGVSSNNFQNTQSPGGQRNNEQLVSNFINPLSGLINISVDGIIFFNGKKDRLTRAGSLYHAGIRVLTGFKTGLINNPSTGRPVNFLNNYACAGIYFQTGAWERNNTRNIGIYWMAARYIVCKSGIDQLREILPAINSNGLYHGWSLAGGVEINNLVNIKLIYYRYLKSPEIDYTLPIYQFSFNYSLK